MSQSSKPTVGQILVALLAAALVPALFVGVLSLSVKTIFVAFLVTSAHAVFLGLPTALILNRFHRVTKTSSMVGGFVVGCIAFGIWSWPLKYPELKTNAWKGAERTQTMIDGVPTLTGWMDYFLLTGMLGFLGFIGGAVFWWFLSKFCEIGAFRRGARSIKSLSWHQRALAALPFVVLAAVATIPPITKDRTCHNIFRDTDVTSIGPRTIFAIQTDWSDSMKIQTALADFASREVMSLRNDSGSYGGDHQGLYVSLCNETGTSISINRYFSGGDSPADAMPFHIGIYSLNNDPAWPALASRLQEKLETQWPGKVVEVRR